MGVEYPLYGDTLSERGKAFSGLMMHKKAGVSQVEVYERAVKSVI